MGSMKNRLCPNKFLVIIGEEVLKNIGQDEVRKTIGKHFGPKLIDMISISRKNSSEARIFIQFDHEDDKRDVMGKWHRSILGNTSVRVDVKKADNDGVIIRNVPP